ncbi:MAG: hypothetical protein ACRDRV_21635 [Pseudonocardiaceae bacterium]
MAGAADPADDPLVGSSLAASLVAISVTNSNLPAWTLLVVGLWAGWYLLACALFPWRACGWCDGGKKRNSSRKYWRECRHCAGSGRKPRIGRRVWTALSRDKRK